MTLTYLSFHVLVRFCEKLVAKYESKGVERL